MKNSGVVKTIRSLERNIEKHLYKIKNNLTSSAIPHWEREIKIFKEQLYLAIKEKIKRGL